MEVDLWAFLNRILRLILDEPFEEMLILDVDDLVGDVLGFLIFRLTLEDLEEPLEEMVIFEEIDLVDDFCLSLGSVFEIEVLFLDFLLGG